MELNRLIRFQGVDETNFHSIFRRSLVIRITARFVEASALVNMPGHNSYGIFERQPDLKEFLQSGPAVLAGIRVQHAFEATHSRSDCEKLITSFSYGGVDNGDTEKYLRQACGLTVQRSIKSVDDGPPPARPLGVDLGISPPTPSGTVPAPDDTWDDLTTRG